MPPERGYISCATFGVSCNKYLDISLIVWSYILEYFKYLNKYKLYKVHVVE